MTIKMPSHTPSITSKVFEMFCLIEGEIFEAWQSVSKTLQTKAQMASKTIEMPACLFSLNFLALSPDHKQQMPVTNERAGHCKS
ncbi:MAG TPA: hypothetical protein VG347_04345 [Verrucomicrobiae bacterium]|nr:hypothetical protein [Verrucomicrobiae bacterium]